MLAHVPRARVFRSESLALAIDTYVHAIAAVILESADGSIASGLDIHVVQFALEPLAVGIAALLQLVLGTEIIHANLRLRT